MNHSQGHCTHSLDLYTHSLGHFTHSLDLYTHSLGHCTHSLDLYTHSLDHCTHSLDLYTRSLGHCTHFLDLYTHSLDHCTHSLDLYTHSLDHCTHSLDLYTHSLGDCTHSLDLYTHSLGHCTHSLDLYTHSLDLYTHSLDHCTHSLDLYTQVHFNCRQRVPNLDSWRWWSCYELKMSFIKSGGSPKSPGETVCLLAAIPLHKQTCTCYASSHASRLTFSGCWRKHSLCHVLLKSLVLSGKVDVSNLLQAPRTLDLTRQSERGDARSRTQEVRVVNGTQHSADSPPATAVTSPSSRQENWQDVVPAVSCWCLWLL